MTNHLTLLEGEDEISYNVGKIWKDEEDGELFILVSVSDRNYSAVSLKDGTCWFHEPQDFRNATNGLTYIGDCEITVKPIVPI